MRASLTSSSASPSRSAVCRTVRGSAVASVLALPSLLFGAAPPKGAPLTVELKTSAGQDAGKATFRQGKGGQLLIKLNLKNLPVGEHAVHVHEKALCDAPDFKSAGGHFNPDAKQHGTLNPAGHHNGDLPHNVTVGENHTAEATFKVDSLSLQPGAANSLFSNGGTSIMVHEKADDMKTDPSGNAGNRIACGVIAAP